MTNEVFANGREISCKSGDGKVIAAFPDVCFTPPENPATPPGVPVPYPISSFSSDSTEGTKDVKINGKEVMLRNVSYFSKCTGDEAGCAAKKGVITSSNISKTYFKSWSMDVKFEGENVLRHFDITTSNHRCEPGNASVPMAEIESMSPAKFEKCSDYVADEQSACATATPHSSGRGLDCSKSPGCAEAKSCILIEKENDEHYCCHPETTGHHLIEVHCFTPPGGRGREERVLGQGNYDEHKAPCVCASGSTNDGTHGLLHSVQGKIERGYAKARRNRPLGAWGDGPNDMSFWTYEEARTTGVLAHKTAFPRCKPTCIRNQLDDYHVRQCGISHDDPLRSDLSVRRREVPLTDAGRRAVVAAVSRVYRIG